MPRPQVEDGYTRIANELLDAMCHLRLQQNQWVVLLAIARKTYGWNKKEDWISGTQIAEMTALPKQRVYEALRALQERRIILRDGKLIGIQKDYSMWLQVTSRRDQDKTRLDVPKDTSRRTQKARIDVPTKDKRHYTKDTTALHPAVLIFAELTGKKPRRGSQQYQQIASRITDNPDRLEEWRTTVEAWLLSGWKSTNVYGMLACFEEGKFTNAQKSDKHKLHPGGVI